MSGFEFKAGWLGIGRGRVRRDGRLAAVLRRRAKQRGVALVMVLSSLAILAAMLTEFQDETSADFGHALSERDALKAEYAARSGIALSRLLIAAEPTIRQAIAPLFMAMRRSPPQIPVWEYADQVLGAFNDGDGAARFKLLVPADLSEGKHLGLSGAGFELQIVDEDSKINFNRGATGNPFHTQPFAVQLMGLLQGQQYDPLFDQADEEGRYHTRQQICSAIVDWIDPDQDSFPCDTSGTQVAGGAEDSFYQLLDRPYERKNAAFDSLEELHYVRGLSDTFWSTFVDPDPMDPKARSVTIWGSKQLNVNNANAQSLYALVCSHAAEAQPLCTDPEQMMKFLTVTRFLKGATAGVPMFSSSRSFMRSLQGKGMLGTAMTGLGIEPVVIGRADDLKKSISTSSKVFSIYSTGTARSGKRRTMKRIHAVVDFRGAPKPTDFAKALGAEDTDGMSQAQLMEAMQGAMPKATLPAEATEETLAAAFRPSPAGRILYYRIR